MPANAGNGLQSLVQEDPLEKEMAKSLVSLPWKPHGQRSMAGYSTWSWKRAGHDVGSKEQQITDENFCDSFR